MLYKSIYYSSSYVLLADNSYINLADETGQVVKYFGIYVPPEKEKKQYSGDEPTGGQTGAAAAAAAAQEAMAAGTTGKSKNTPGGPKKVGKNYTLG